MWVYKLEINPLPKLNKDCQFKTKNNSFEFQCFRQNNTHDCGLFTIIHMREFIVSVLSESMEYLLADCKNIQKLSCYNFHQNKDKYDPFQLLEMRQTSVYIICNIITKHQPNISVKKRKAVDAIITSIKECFLSTSEVVEVKKKMYHELLTPPTYGDSINTSLSKELEAEANNDKGLPKDTDDNNKNDNNDDDSNRKKDDNDRDDKKDNNNNNKNNNENDDNSSSNDDKSSSQSDKKVAPEDLVDFDDVPSTSEDDSKDSSYNEDNQSKAEEKKTEKKKQKATKEKKH